MTTLAQKATISGPSALLFALLNLPATYQLTDRLLPFVSTYDWSSNCPTTTGLLVHAGVFYLVSYLSMRGLRTSNATKMRHSLVGTLLFLIAASPATYAFVGRFLPSVADLSGCPTNYGVLVHSFVFFLLLIGVMYL